MNFLILLAGILTFAVTASLISFHGAFNHYFSVSGLLSLDESIVKSNDLCIIGTVLSFLFILVLLYSNNIYLSFITLDIQIALSIIELYYGLILWFDPKLAVLSFYKNWENKYNDILIESLKDRLQCCGFFRTGEFIGEPCNGSSIPCFKALSTYLGDLNSQFGLGILFNSIVLLISALLLYNTSERTKSKSKDQLQADESQPLIEK